MEVNIEELLDKVSNHVKTLASTETVLGEEFKLGDYTCRPVIKVGTGFGSGAGEGEDPKRKNQGSGGGAVGQHGHTPQPLMGKRTAGAGFPAPLRVTLLPGSSGAVASESRRIQGAWCPGGARRAGRRP